MGKNPPVLTNSDPNANATLPTASTRRHESNAFSRAVATKRGESETRFFFSKPVEYASSSSESSSFSCSSDEHENVCCASRLSLARNPRRCVSRRSRRNARAAAAAAAGDVGRSQAPPPKNASSAFRAEDGGAVCALSRRCFDASHALFRDSTRASAAPSRSSTATATCARALRRQASAEHGASVVSIKRDASSASASRASASVSRVARTCVSRSAGKVTGFLPSARATRATEANRPASETKRARGGGAGAGTTACVSCSPSPREGQTSHRARLARISRDASSSERRDAHRVSRSASLDAFSFSRVRFREENAIVGSISKHETKLTATSRRNPSSASKASANNSGSIQRSAAMTLRAFAPPSPPDPPASVPSKPPASSRTLLGIDTSDSRKARCNVVSKKNTTDVS